MKYFLVLLFFMQVNNASAQADTSKMAFPPGTTERQKAAYLHFFRKVKHPPAYYDLPVAQQMQFDINMHKSQTLRSKGWLLLGVGALFAGVAAAIPTGTDKAHTNVIFYSLGGACAVGSIPCFIYSGKRREKAELIISNSSGAVSWLRFSPQVGLRLSL